VGFRLSWKNKKPAAAHSPESILYEPAGSRHFNCPKEEQD
jgi:hypothetical protein